MQRQLRSHAALTLYWTTVPLDQLFGARYCKSWNILHAGTKMWKQISCDTKTFAGKIFLFFFVNILYKDAALELSPPSNSSRTIGSNKRRSRIVAAASRGTRRRGRIVSDDCQQATPRAIRIVRVASTADSRIERVRVPLTASSNHQRLPP